jgi:hypothetical protein
VIIMFRLAEDHSNDADNAIIAEIINVTTNTYPLRFKVD